MEDLTTMNYEYDHENLGLDDLLFFDGMIPSIHGDCLKEKDPYGEGLNFWEEDLKPEIRNADLMWSATAGCNNATNISTNGNNSAASSYSETNAMAFAEVSGSTNPYSTYQRQQSQTQQGQTQQQQESTDDQFPVVIKQEQVDMDYVYAEKRRRLSGGSDKKSQSEAQNEDQLIPPGGSLLRKRNPPMMTSLSSTRKVSELKNRKIQRPDTPHSLNDEVAAPEFRHNVDLRACVMGSNNISLTSDVDVSSISQINGYLQNAAKGLFPARFPINDMNDVLDVLNQEVQSQSKQTQQHQQQQAAIDKVVSSSTVASPPTTSSDCDSDDGESNHYARLRRNQSSKIINNSYSMMLHSDHSYTRCNEMVDDGPNIETPSDSDEEIDVVSYTDKKLPNNPSCQIMGALQTKMAHKISVDQKKPRYGNYNLPYTPASSSPVKSVANSRYPSPSSTPYQNCSSAMQSYSPLSVECSSSSSSSSSTSSISSGLVANTTQKGRKHYYHLNVATDGIGSRRIMQLSSTILRKKCRGKKASAVAAAAATAANISSSSSSSSCSGSISPVAQSQQSSSLAAHNWQRQSSSTSSSGLANSGRNNNQFSLDEADTIEKRNQHNDMERQRRIGLKNLFEALKKQIPTIRDKERAPKVNILREAAKLCEQLTREEQELSLQRQMLKEKLKQQQELLARFRLAKSEQLEANSG